LLVVARGLEGVVAGPQTAGIARLQGQVAIRRHQRLGVAAQFQIEIGEGAVGLGQLGVQGGRLLEFGRRAGQIVRLQQGDPFVVGGDGLVIARQLLGCRRRGRLLLDQGVADAHRVLELGLERSFEGLVARLLEVDQVLLGGVEDEQHELPLLVADLLQLVAGALAGEGRLHALDRLVGLVQHGADDSPLARGLERRGEAQGDERGQRYATDGFHESIPAFLSSVQESGADSRRSRRVSPSDESPCNLPAGRSDTIRPQEREVPCWPNEFPPSSPLWPRPASTAGSSPASSSTTPSVSTSWGFPARASSSPAAAITCSRASASRRSWSTTSSPPCSTICPARSPPTP